MAADQELPLASLSSPCQLHHAAFYCVGFSCALAALGAQGNKVVGGCDLGAGWRGCRWSRARELALREKVAELERKVEELRHRRAEDARANEKVAGIFASHEQRWLSERKALRRQVDAVVVAARARDAKREEEAEALRREAEEQRRAADEALARREGAEERAREAERAAEELRERARKDAAEHASELRKHKAAFVELAAAQRQLEADLASAARLADAAEAELRAALERRDEAAVAAADLAAEAARLRRDADHKDKILSAMLRKSKVDMEDREMLVREVKLCKARRKQAELEAERWRKTLESRGSRRSSRSSARAADHPGCSDKLALDVVARASDTKILFVDHVDSDGKKAPAAKEVTTVECVDRYPSHVEDKPAVEEYHGLQEWFQLETEKYAAMIKHRHAAEIEAFTEQLRLKDEKLEAFRWRAVSTDVEATRLRSRVQELEARLAQHEQHGADLEALLLDREKEKRALREQLEELQARALHGGDQDDSADDEDRCVPCSPFSPEKNEVVTDAERSRRQSRARHQDGTEVAATKDDEPGSPEVDKAFDAEAAIAACGVLVQEQSSTEHEHHDDVLARHSSSCEIEEEKEVLPDPGQHAHSQASSTTSSCSSQDATTSTSSLALVVAAPPERRPPACKADIHALAVSYKIKRLKQQLAVLEKLAAEASRKEDDEGGSSKSSRERPRSRYHTMMSFLSKHVKRYQSLDDRIDDLCARMEESKRSGGRERRARGEGERAALAQFLEETFQLQRLLVATGQKLLETQSRIAPGLVVVARRGRGRGDDDGDGADMKRLMEVAGALLRDVQRGLEVRLARIIGDLEGTLTFHGILNTTTAR